MISIHLYALIYGCCPFFVLLFFFIMIQTQDYDNNCTILNLLITGAIWWSVDFLLFVNKSYDKIKTNEFIAIFFKFLKIGEIPIWVLMICLFMSITYKRTGKICICPPQE